MASNTRLRLLAALTTTLGALLLFLVQPMIARIILPAFGGAAAVWMVCLLFFQTLLLAGYFYAHVLATRLPVRRQVMVHAGLAIAAIACGVLFSDASVATASPTLGILALLTLRIGPAFLVLAGTSPLVGHWYSFESENPFRLYALSNFGSLAALLVYPFAIEPFVDLRVQFNAWLGGLGLYLACCIALYFEVAERPADALSAGRTPVGQKSIWLALAATGSIVLLSVSNALTREIAPIPLLWVLPLSLYLVTFILSFDHPRWYRPTITLVVWLASVGALIAMKIDPSAWSTTFYFLAHAALLFFGCLLCHGELSRRRPGPGRLTEFYLTIAAGGAAGALFVSLLAPRLFVDYYELEIGVVLTLAIGGFSLLHHARRFRPVWNGLLAVSVVSLSGYFIYDQARDNPLEIATARSFYAHYRIERSSPLFREESHILFDDSVAHGSQLVANPRVPTSYYSTQSGVGIALDEFPSRDRKIAVIGLGTGTLATYGVPGDRIRFYEIDPAVIDLAQRHFSYLKDSAARIEIVPGDARISLEREAHVAPGSFDLIVLDAFSGDAIPIHLLTREAWRLYWRLLKPDGILALHISNRHIELTPVIRAHNNAGGQREVIEIESPAEPQWTIYEANWLLVTGNRNFLAREPVRANARPVESNGEEVTWTDARASVLPVLEL